MADTRACSLPLDRLQVLDQVCLLSVSQTRLKKSVVVIDDVGERGEAAIVVVAALVDLGGVSERA